MAALLPALLSAALSPRELPRDGRRVPLAQLRGGSSLACTAHVQATVSDEADAFAKLAEEFAVYRQVWLPPVSPR